MLGGVPLKRAQLKHAAPSRSPWEGISPGRGRGGVAALRLGAGSPGRRWLGQRCAPGRPGWPCPAPPGPLCPARPSATSLKLVGGGSGLGSLVGILCLILRWTRGVSGGAGVVSAICSTNQEFRKGNHTKCICYFKIRFFISFFFFPAESQSTFFLREHCLILYFFLSS